MLVRQCELERPELMHKLAHEFIIYRGMKVCAEDITKADVNEMAW